MAASASAKRITELPVTENFNGPFYQRLAQTLRRMVSEHRHHFSTPDDNILHLGINTEDGSFFYNRVNEQRITIGQAVSGDGIDRILDYFSQHILFCLREQFCGGTRKVTDPFSKIVLNNFAEVPERLPTLSAKLF